ncbi:hypothetical protein C8R41DRAFT_863744 [Lentinula lateritia]|uniref:hAT-like transposase RNase-H fold domain-containing protein n=1 Tax=Lentinula lateritia TaxID=40482 RepID=A0ABQ8VTQ4_9AGAR|nr:hypothetical protein C8R41DRAFT_863744 [Lentinula lateritia]
MQYPPPFQLLTRDINTLKINFPQTSTQSELIQREKLIHAFNTSKEHLPKISHAIGASVEKLKEYLGYAWKNRVYVLAMVLHPGIKLDWLEKHWSTEDFLNAKAVVYAAMLEYQQSSRKTSAVHSVSSTPLRRTVSMPSASSAARAQTSGMQNFSDLRQRHALRRSQIQLGPLPSPSPLTSHSSAPDYCQSSVSEISESDLERQQRELAEDSIAVNEEFERYINAGAIGEDDARLNDLDLIRYWQWATCTIPSLQLASPEVGIIKTGHC